MSSKRLAPSTSKEQKLTQKGKGKAKNRGKGKAQMKK